MKKPRARRLADGLRRAGLLAAALCLWVLAWPGSAHARPHRRAPEALRQLRADIAAVLERTGVPGVGIAVVDRDGVIYSGGVGLADPESGRPVGPDTVFRVGSITKSIVALGVVALAERGWLDLDADVRTVAPEIEIVNRWPDAPITVAHLLEHTAGFDDMRFNETFGAPEVERLALTEALAVNPRSRVARWQPGTRFAYANPGYTVAAHVIERVTGGPYEAWLHEAVLDPLGMPDARLRHDPKRAAELARGYRAPGITVPYQGLVHRPAGSLMATPAELARLVGMWLHRGEDGPRVVGPAWLDRIERTGTLPYPPIEAGYGLGNYGDVLHPAVGRGHNGGLPGYLSCYLYFPELGVGYVMLLNASHSAVAYLEIRALLFAFLTADLELPAPPRVDVPPEALARWVGHYGFDSPRHELFGFIERTVAGVDVRIHDGQLWLEPLVGGRFPLVPTGADRFRLPGRSGTQVQFVRGENDDVMLVQGSYFERSARWIAQWRLRGIITTFWLMLGAVALVAWWLATWWPRRWLGWRTPGDALRLLAPSAAAALALYAAFAALLAAAETGALGTANPRTIAVFVLTLLFASGSGLALVKAVRAAMQPGPSPPVWVRAYALAVAVAGSTASLWLTHQHVIGLRTWAW